METRVTPGVLPNRANTSTHFGPKTETGGELVKATQLPSRGDEPRRHVPTPSHTMLSSRASLKLNTPTSPKPATPAKAMYMHHDRLHQSSAYLNTSTMLREILLTTASCLSSCLPPLLHAGLQPEAARGLVEPAAPLLLPPKNTADAAALAIFSLVASSNALLRMVCRS